MFATGKNSPSFHSVTEARLGQAWRTYPIQLYPARSFHLAVFEWSINCFFFRDLFLYVQYIDFRGQNQMSEIVSSSMCLYGLFDPIVPWLHCCVRHKISKCIESFQATQYAIHCLKRTKQKVDYKYWLSRKMDKDRWPCGIHCLSSYSNYTKSFTKSARFGALPPMNFLLPTAFIHFSASSYMASRTLFLILYLKRKTSHWFKG